LEKRGRAKHAGEFVSGQQEQMSDAEV